VYPLYVLGVWVSLAALALRGRLFTVRPSALLAQTLLMQALSLLALLVHKYKD
jgi:hypothetical protein